MVVTGYGLRLQLQQLHAQLDNLERPSSPQQAQCASSDDDQAWRLAEVNSQLEEHVASLDLQLHQTQQTLQASLAEVERLKQSLRAQHEDHRDEADLMRSELDQMQEECTSKGLQVGHVETLGLC